MRQTIADLADSIMPHDLHEKKAIEFVKNWVASGVEIFRIAKPNIPNIHLVSYFVLIDQTTNQILLTDHKKAQLWLPPGGHVEINEHPKETAQREAQEELGIEAEFLLENPLFLTLGQADSSGTIHIDVSFWYVLKGNVQEKLNYSLDEFHQIRWFNWKELPFSQAEPNLPRFVDKVISKLITLNSYDASAEKYAKNTENFHPKEEAEKFLSLLPKKAKILDIGCGPGRDAKLFLSHGFDVTGIDISSKMIQVAKENAPGGSFQVMDIESLNFPSETFDGIWANNSLLHIPKKNMPFVFQKMCEALKPNGILYVSLKQSEESEALMPDSRYKGLEKFWAFYDQSELLTLLNKTNFQIIDTNIVEKKRPYETHNLIRIFARKGLL